MLGKVEICGVNTADLKVLSSDACRALLIRAKHGDRDAREQLIAGNLRLVLSVIQKFTGRGESADDLFQVGCIGLIKAIDNFDAENHDVRFSTYGVPMISGEIRRYLRDNSPIRVSRSTRDTAYQVLQEKERLTAATGREPSLDEIAKSLGLPRQTVVFALDAISDPISLYEPIYTDCDLSEERARKLYEDYYADAALTFVSDRSVCLKQVVNTSKCVLSVEKHGDKLLVVSAIDNLLKGASGQAVQNMNLMFGLDERAGLRLKPVAF